jgi:hypothetical protein
MVAYCPTWPVLAAPRFTGAHGGSLRTSRRKRLVSCTARARAVVSAPYSWVARQPDVDLSFDIRPFLGTPQVCDQGLEAVGSGRGVLEPGEQVEVLTQVASVVQSPRNGREVFEPDGDVVGPTLENRPSLVLGEFPPASVLRMGIRAAQVASALPSGCWTRTRASRSGRFDVALVAREPRQPPPRPRPPVRTSTLEDLEVGSAGKGVADDCVEALDLPATGVACLEGDKDRSGHARERLSVFVCPFVLGQPCGLLRTGP